MVMFLISYYPVEKKKRMPHFCTDIITITTCQIFGDKTKAKKLAIEAGVSVVPGTDGCITKEKEAEDF
eukprot:8789066-Ditylum_brightwellii.AAC.1